METDNRSLASNLQTGQLAAMIDHTLLKADSTQEAILRLCMEARQFKFATVCINPFWVPLAAAELKETSVGVATVIGFPLGATTTAAKAAEAKEAVKSGATEIDMVINIGALKSGELQAVQNDIEQVAAVCKGRAILKVILETGFLSDDEKKTACLICKNAGADFVKTSTGFGPGGATEADIALMREAVGLQMGVKASGGIRDRETTLKMIAAGATRIGTSSGVAIVGGQKTDNGDGGSY